MKAKNEEGKDVPSEEQLVLLSKRVIRMIQERKGSSSKGKERRKIREN